MSIPLPSSTLLHTGKWFAVIVLLLLPLFTQAQPGTVLDEQILATGGLPFLGSEDNFGNGPTRIGDLDGDGTEEVVIGAPAGQFDARGRVYVLFMNPDGTFRDVQTIGGFLGGFSGDIINASFGNAAAPLGDLDGDGTPDIAVGARLDDDGGTSPSTNRGAVWILFMNPDGTVKAEQKISDTEGGLSGTLDNSDDFGSALAALGDLDGDGTSDLAVGASGDDDGGSSRGAVWVLFLNTDGTVKAEQKISSTAGGFTGTLDNSDDFGTALAALGDLDSDGVVDLAVGATDDDDGGVNVGAAWVLFLNTDGTVKAEQKISSTAGGFSGTLDNSDRFGTALASVGDLDGDGIPDLAVGANGDDDGGSSRGAVWVLFLNANGTVKDEQKISDAEGGLTGPLDNFDNFGAGLGSLGDLDGDGVDDLAVGIPFRDADDQTNLGATLVLSLNSDGTIKAEQEISLEQGFSLGGFRGGPSEELLIGTALASLGDFNGDGTNDLAVSDGRESVFLLFMNPDGTVKDEQRIAEGSGGFGGSASNFSDFGNSLAALGDVDGDGITDLAVGAPGEFSGDGAVWILLLNADGTVKDEQQIAEGIGGFGGSLINEALFGFALAPLGDLDGDGTPDLATSNVGTGITGSGKQSVWILFLNPDGTVKDEQRITSGVGGFNVVLDNSDSFGVSLAPVGDFNGDGIVDLAVGASSDDDGGENRGAVYLLLLNTDGTVADSRKVSDTLGGFTGTLDDSDLFGWSLAPVGDLNSDGTPDLAVGALFDDDGGLSTSANRGAVWLLFLNPNLEQEPVLSFQKISDTAGGLATELNNNDNLGSSIAPAGDLNSDGIPDLAVGARGTDFLLNAFGAGSNLGAVYLLTLDGIAPTGPDYDLQATSTTPLTVAAGEAVSFDYTITNNTTASVSGDFFFRATRGGNTVAQGVILSGSLPAGQTVASSFTQQVPGNAPLGTYDYSLRIGQFPGLTVDSEAFTVTITAAARESVSEAWDVANVEPWQAIGALREEPTAAANREGGLPTEVVLVGAYPNPFSRQATVGFALPEAQRVTVKVYDVLGREVARLVDGEIEAGRHEAVLDGASLPSGVYLVRLVTATGTQTERLTLVR